MKVKEIRKTNYVCMEVKGYKIQPLADLEGANLEESNLRYADLEEANLKELYDLGIGCKDWQL